MVSDWCDSNRARERRVRSARRGEGREVHSGRWRNASGSEVVCDGIAEVLNALYEMVLDAVCDDNGVESV